METYHAHTLAEYPNQRLVIDGDGVGEEEVGEGEMQQGHRGDDCRCRDESHGCEVGGLVDLLLGDDDVMVVVVCGSSGGGVLRWMDCRVLMSTESRWPVN